MLEQATLLLTDMIREAAHPLVGEREDYDRLMRMIGDAHVVLIGEASHGTHEFYRERAQITKRLIQEKGFSAVAVEADWPDAYRVNRYVRGTSDDEDATDSLKGFKRFPAWMWRNADVLDFVGWLRTYNDDLPNEAAKVGFYGLDLYSLHTSIEAVLTYLDKIDSDAAQRARNRYACFDHFGKDEQSYGYATGLGLAESCEQEVVNQLLEIHRRATEFARRDGRVAMDDYFYAWQNARLVMHAERYYRSMFRGRVSSWNLRDSHMAETLDSLLTYFGNQNRNAKVVVWEHNSHLGDARATSMGQDGEWNVGQLVRERYGHGAFLVGMTTYHGTVTAASNWDAPAERKRVRPALGGSYETVFHDAHIPRFLLTLRDDRHTAAALREPMLERAIGVIYRPETERQSHYFHAHLSDQFDAVIHFDETRAVEPLERTTEWDAGEVPETFPTGI
ncbi:MAG TPA: erythromycin esterase family protein [Pyrinomonadaceae bacterium]|nr:erythromycin esterase family protein [Pyrinomonadaceae bacterium]